MMNCSTDSCRVWPNTSRLSCLTKSPVVSSWRPAGISRTRYIICRSLFLSYVTYRSDARHVGFTRHFIHFICYRRRHTINFHRNGPNRRLSRRRRIIFISRKGQHIYEMEFGQFVFVSKASAFSLHFKRFPHLSEAILATNRRFIISIWAKSTFGARHFCAKMYVWTRNTLRRVIILRALFSSTYLLNLVKPELAPFNPLTPKTPS